MSIDMIESARLPREGSERAWTVGREDGHAAIEGDALACLHQDVAAAEAGRLALDRRLLRGRLLVPRIERARIAQQHTGRREQQRLARLELDGALEEGVVVGATEVLAQVRGPVGRVESTEKSARSRELARSLNHGEGCQVEQRRWDDDRLLRADDRADAEMALLTNDRQQRGREQVGAGRASEVLPVSRLRTSGADLMRLVESDDLAAVCLLEEQPETDVEQRARAGGIDERIRQAARSRRAEKAHVLDDD